MLRFRLGSVPVTVSGSFAFVAVLAGTFEPEVVIPWTVAVFVAVLLHEAGHAFTARAYGAAPVTITLFALGGVTMYPAHSSLTSGRRFVIAAAGSTVGIVTGGLLLIVYEAGLFADANAWVHNLVISFIWAALGWGVLNWIPIRPLDGGQMMTSVLEIVAPRRAEMLSKVISVLFGVAAIYLAIRIEQPFAAVLVAFITLVGLMSPETAPAGPIMEPEEPTGPDERTRIEPPEFPI